MPTDFNEGQKAKERFERGMTALFSVPKAAVVRAEKKQKGKRASSRDQSVRKPKRSDKD
jgi:hypothetical protein